MDEQVREGLPDPAVVEHVSRHEAEHVAEVASNDPTQREDDDVDDDQRAARAVDGDAVALEHLLAIKRAGADFILTYLAREMAETLGA